MLSVRACKTDARRSSLSDVSRRRGAAAEAEVNAPGMRSAQLCSGCTDVWLAISDDADYYDVIRLGQEQQEL